MSRCVLTLGLKTEPWQEDVINKRLEMIRNVYNVMLGYENKKYRKLQKQPEYIEAMNTLYEFAKSGQKGCKEYKEAGKKRSQLLKEAGFSQYSFGSDAISFSKHFVENIGSKSAQISIGDAMWRAFDTMLYGKGDIVHFKRKDSVNSVASDNKSGIRVVDVNNKTVFQRDTQTQLFVLYGLNKHKTVKIPIKFDMNNPYELEMLSMPIKQVRILRRKEKMKWKYYIQLCLDGKPAVKYDKDTGEIKHPIGTGRVGLFVNTNSITVSTEKGIKHYSLSEGLIDYSEEIAELQRYMDNSRRQTNPDNFNSDGTIKKGIMIDGERRPLTWHYSNRYYKAKNRVAELKRLDRVKRELHHQKLANEIVSMGNDIRVNVYPFAKVAKRSTEDKLKKDGSPASKARAGKSIGENAPALLISMIEQKLNNYDNGILVKFDLTKEADFYDTLKNTEKWAEFVRSA